MEEERQRRREKELHLAEWGLCDPVARLSWASPPNLSVFASLSLLIPLWLSVRLRRSRPLTAELVWIFAGSVARGFFFFFYLVPKIWQQCRWYWLDWQCARWTLDAAAFNGRHVQSTRSMLRTQETRLQMPHLTGGTTEETNLSSGPFSH